MHVPSAAFLFLLPLAVLAQRPGGTGSSPAPPSSSVSSASTANTASTHAPSSSPSHEACQQNPGGQQCQMATMSQAGAVKRYRMEYNNAPLTCRGGMLPPDSSVNAIGGLLESEKNSRPCTKL